jgi:glycosyltransferase involved in cell wall biosynthesis
MVGYYRTTSPLTIQRNGWIAPVQCHEMTPLAQTAAPPLRIAIDGLALLGQRTGIGHLTADLGRALAERPDVSVVAFAIGREAYRELPAHLPAGVRPGTSQVPARLVEPFWKRAHWPPIESWTGAVDVVHGTNYWAPPARAPVIVSIHDLTFLHRPELVHDDTRAVEPGIRRLLDRGATVHVISDFVGAEVCDAFGLPPGRVRRAYPGITGAHGGNAKAGQARAGADRYVLALGQLEPRKNLPMLVRAFDRIDGDPDLALVIAGPDGWARDEFFAAVSVARRGDRVRWLGYVSDAERRDLLAGASVFAYPSLYEGFGLPPLEAMAAGVPVLASNRGAIPEVAGDAALFVDPTDVDALAGGISVLLDDPDRRDAAIRSGRKRAERFSWASAVEGFVEMYTTVAGAR